MEETNRPDRTVTPYQVTPLTTQTPNAQLTIPISGNTLTFIDAPPLPPFMSSFFSNIFLSRGEEKLLLQTTTQVLKSMGATNAQIASVAKDRNTQKELCALLCSENGGQALVEMMKQDGDLVLTVSPNANLNELDVLIDKLKRHGMPVQAAALIVGIMVRADADQRLERIQLRRLAALLKAHPDVVLPKHLSQQLNFLVTKHAGYAEDADDAEDAGHTDALSSEAINLLLKHVGVATMSTPAQLGARKLQAALAIEIDRLPMTLHKVKDPKVQREILDQLTDDLTQLLEDADRADEREVYEFASGMIGALADSYPSVAESDAYLKLEAESKFEKARKDIEGKLPGIQIVFDEHGGTITIQIARKTDAKPADAKPADAKPADAKPSDAKPSDAKASDAKPSDAKASDAEPTDAESAEARAAAKQASKEAAKAAAAQALDAGADLVEMTATPEELLDYLSAATDVTAALSASHMTAYMTHPKIANSSTFAPAVVRDLWIRHAASNPPDARYAINQWLDTISRDPPSAEELRAFASLCATESDAAFALDALDKAEAALALSDARLETSLDFTHARVQICAEGNISQALLESALLDILQLSGNVQALGPDAQVNLLNAALQLDPGRLRNLEGDVEDLLANADESPNVLGAMFKLLATDRLTIDDVVAEISKWTGDAQLGKSELSHLFLPLVSSLVLRLAPKLVADAKKFETTEPMKKMAGVIATLARQFDFDAPYEVMTTIFDSLAKSDQGMEMIDAMLPALQESTKLDALVVVTRNERINANMMLAACVAAKARAGKLADPFATIASNPIAGVYLSLCFSYQSQKLGNADLAKKHLAAAVMAYTRPAVSGDDESTQWHEAATVHVNAADPAGENARAVRKVCNDYLAKRSTHMFDPDDGVLHALHRLAAEAVNRNLVRTITHAEARGMFQL